MQATPQPAGAVFVVIMYAVNKDQPKSTSPFEGPPAATGMQAHPPPAQANLQEKAAQPSAPVAAQGGESPIKGTIEIAPSLASSAPQNGTVFITARNAGM